MSADLIIIMKFNGKWETLDENSLFDENISFVFFFSFYFADSIKVKKTDLPVMPPEDILPSLDDEADESSMDDGKLKMSKSIKKPKLRLIILLLLLFILF